MEKKKIIIIDGNSLLFRAYYATSYGDESSIMRTSKGIPVNAIFAFSNMILKILTQIDKNCGVFVGFDKDGNTFRKQEFEDYKANRKPCPEPLVQQFPISREMLNAFSIQNYEESGIEADDICGSLAKQAAVQGYEVEIYTSDKDYLQLVDKNIILHLIKTGLSNTELVNITNIKEKFGYLPSQVVDYKGLRGDSSDNLPGIPGVGEKTALKFLEEFNSFENIIEAAKNGQITGKIAEKIVENEELGRKSYKLAKIKIDAELPFSVQDCEYKGFDYEQVKCFCEKYELRNLLSRVPVSLSTSKEDDNVPQIEDINSLDNINIGNKIGLAIDIDFLNYHNELPKGIAIYSQGHTYYLKENCFNDSKLKTILENESIEKYVFDSKCLYYIFKKYGIDLKGVAFDILLSSYLLDSSLNMSPRAIFGYYGIPFKEEQEISLFDQVEDNTNIGIMAYFSFKLFNKIKEELIQKECFDLLNNIELPLAKILAKMEFEGFPLDKSILEEMGKSFKEKRDSIEQFIFEKAGEKFNIASPKQVLEFLHKRGFTAIDSTSVEVLEEIGKIDPIALDILEYRKYAKLLSTYVDGLIPHIQEDEKIHTYFNQALTSTGRLSSSNPNLQNISARDEEGRQIRKAFFYKDGSKILSLDYGQIELRILAELANSPHYIEVFNSDRDVHTETARKLFKIPQEEEVPSALRRKAKAINFAIIYGTTPYGLSEQIGCSPKEASAFIAAFYKEYPEIAEFLHSITAKAINDGYVNTMFGRRRYIKDINSANFGKREAAKRQALNAPVQGSAADLIKIAMIKIDEFLLQNNLKTKMVLQIHDELLFKVDSNEEDFIIDKLKEIMNNAINIRVKLTTEGSLGLTWYDAKE
ncbi:MAG: DNA polymerase I [Bacilli bacterium]|nr:DNA polymerase I [Bacilli bacterium]MDY6430942.1 DNA polymerase I [Bacilli bacterium]